MAPVQDTLVHPGGDTPTVIQEDGHSSLRKLRIPSLGSKATVRTLDCHCQGHPGAWGRAGRDFLPQGEGAGHPGETRAGDRPDAASSVRPRSLDSS